jgi:secondary thiamine-phosphate synthase enzyme
MPQTTFVLTTPGPGLTDFSREVSRWLGTTGVAEGLLTLIVRHTSSSLLIQENADPSVRADLETFLARLIPAADDPASSWITHRSEGPDDMPAHIKAALLPVALTIPVSGGRLALGTWQGIYLWEHRDRPHRRQVTAHLA